MDNTHDRLDSFKLAAAKAVVETLEMPKLRQHGISNLARWRDSGVWCGAYGEWLDLLINKSDAEVLEAMIGERKFESPSAIASVHRPVERAGPYSAMAHICRLTSRGVRRPRIVDHLGGRQAREVEGRSEAHRVYNLSETDHTMLGVEMRRKFGVVGTIDQNTRVFGTTYGPFSLLVAAAFEKQFKDLEAHATTPGESMALAPGKTLSPPDRDVPAP